MQENCYKCEHSRETDDPGFLRCVHPEVGKTLQASGHQYAILKGWFNWPVSFKAMWLRGCKGYTVKDERDAND